STTTGFRASRTWTATSGFGRSLSRTTGSFHWQVCTPSSSSRCSQPLCWLLEKPEAYLRNWWQLGSIRT
ncbi:unnamed protein product, partial [Polarella glacialis]